jgi:chromosome segregation ATPase
MTQEEAEELKQELQDLKQQVAAHQQQQDQQDHQQQLHAAEVQAWRAERSQLQQAVEDAQAAAAKAQEDADKQLQQLQANADSQEGLMRHLSWQLEAAQQALQQQQHDDEQQQQQPSQPDGSSAAASGCVLAQVSEDKACSAARILQFLADEVQELSRQEAVHQCLTDQLLGEASSAADALVGWLRCCMAWLAQADDAGQHTATV